MNQWLLPDTKAEPASDKEMAAAFLDANERMGMALAFAYRMHPWIKTEIQRYLSDEGVEPPAVEERVFVTYRRSDGKPCFGEYSFMTFYDGLEEEESDIIEERWVLEGKRLIPQPHSDADDDYEDLYEEDTEGVRKFKEQ